MNKCEEIDIEVKRYMNKIKKLDIPEYFLRLGFIIQDLFGSI